MSEQRPQSGQPGALRIGSLVGVDVFISSTWVLMAIIFTVSFAPAIERAQPGLGALKYLAGLSFVVLFYLSVLLHEMSHAVAAKRYGIPVHSITLSFFGGATEIEGEADGPKQEFVIAVVGPITSILIGVILFPVALLLDGGLLELAVGGISVTNVVVGVLNLLPGMPFDGGRVLRSVVWAISGNRHRATLIAGQIGRGLAVVVASAPIWLPAIGLDVSTYDLIMLPVLGFFLWSAASASIAYAKIRLALPDLQARRLARRALAVPEDLPLSEALRRAREQKAGALVTTDAAGMPYGIVVETAVAAVPEARRPWTPVSTVARTLTEGLRLPADLDGDLLIRAMQRFPATEYLLLEPTGAVYGVLSTADVDAAFADR